MDSSLLWVHRKIDMNVTVRTAKQEDAEAIGSIHVACWHETYTGIISQGYLDQLDPEKRQEMWLDAIKRGQTIFVAEAANRIVGFANGGKNRESTIDASGVLYAIYLLADYQKQGIGKQLFRAVEEDLSAQNLTPFITWVLEKNPACGFYKKVGGEIVADQLEEIGGVNFKEIAYLWKD